MEWDLRCPATDEQMVQYWGEGGLVRWSAENLQEVAIPGAVRRFLIEVGLPRPSGPCEFMWRFGPTLRPSNAKSRYWPIGAWTDWDTLALDQQNQGDIVILCGETHFTNSGVRQFAHFLCLWRKYCELGDTDVEEPLDRGNRLALLDQVEKRMGEVDPAAMADGRHWWPMLLAGERDDMGASEAEP